MNDYIYFIFVRFRVELNKRLPWLAIKETVSETSSTATEATTTPNPAAPAST